ncbi:MAG TPA: response regulator [Polyangiaceae bacterium]
MSSTTSSTAGRIMLIDDDVGILQSVKRMLVRQGYCVATHEGGPGCCIEVARFAPRLVLIDVRMPFLSGDVMVGLLEKRTNAERPRIVLFSAIDEFRLQQTAKACGADGYIPKSDSLLELARKVAGFFRDN